MKKKQEEEIIDLKFQISELKQKLAVREGELEVFREISGIFLSPTFEAGGAPGFDDVLGSSLELILRVVEAEAGTVYIRKETGDEIVFRVVRGFKSGELTGKTLRVGEGIAGWVVETGRPYVSTRVDEDPRWKKEYAELIDFATREILCVPLRSGEEVFGAIEVINKQGGHSFAKEDLENLASLANQVSIVIENARLFLESNRRMQQHADLIEISAMLNSSLDPLVVRRKAMEAATRLMGAEVGSLLLLDSERGELYFEVALGEKGEVMKEIRLKLGEGIAGWVAEHGEPLVVPDVSLDPRHFKQADERSSFQTRDMICVPVKVKDKPIGVLQAINKIGEGTFTSEDLELFISLANQVAIAIDNANLYSEIHRTFLETADALAEAIEKRDPYTGGHTNRVVWYSTVIADELELSEEEKERLKIGAILHDIGKIGVEDRILRKPGPLEDDEFRQMSQHPKIGAEIIKHIEGLRDIVPAILYHQERFDGRGYPSGIQDGEIPMSARIIAVADTFDAMTTDRPYRKALGDQVAIAELEKFAGTQFDREVVFAFLRAYEKGRVRPEK